MGFTEVLTIVFIVLKVFGKIDWSWWLVLLPEIIALVFYLGFVICNVCFHVRIRKQVFKNFRKW